MKNFEKIAEFSEENCNDQRQNATIDVYRFCMPHMVGNEANYAWHLMDQNQGLLTHLPLDEMAVISLTKF